MKTDHLFLIARWLLAGIFVNSAVAKILNPAKPIGQLGDVGMPVPEFFYFGALVLLSVGVASLLSGKYLRHGVAALVIFLVPTTILFHAELSDPSERIAFFKNLAILGGLLLVEAHSRLRAELAAAQTPRP